MPKASPIIRSFNAGEFSELLRGRVDLEKHPASLRRMNNIIAAPQGPAIARSGTRHMATCADATAPSYIEPFVFSEEDAYVLEFAEDRIRVLLAEGLLVRTYEQCTITSAAGEILEVASSTLSAEVGEDVVIAGAPSVSNLNFRQARVTAVQGNVYTFAGETTLVSGAAITMARVFHIPSDFTTKERQTLRFIQSLDTVYILNEVGRVRKLSRISTYNWTLEKVLFNDGPYLSRTDREDATTLTPSSTGSLIGQSASTFSSSNRPLIDGSENNGTEDDVRFLGRAIDYVLSASSPAFAFDGTEDTYWAANNTQTGTVGAIYATAKTISGYTIYAARDNQDGTYLNKDYAPSSWTLEGSNNGSTWTTLDIQEDYILYDNNKSVFFEVNTNTAYTQFRLNIKSLVTNGLIEPRVRSLVLKDKDASLITITASSTTGINFNQGFLNTDVDRSLRMRGSDNAWRELRIAEVVSPTQVRAELVGEPFIDLIPVSRWRLGVWSDTTGWPSVGVFFGDRLFLGGSEVYRDTLAMSVVGAYETFSPTDSFGAVLDANGGVFTLNARRLARIRWMTADRRGVLMGTGSLEYTVRSASGPFTARTAEANPSTSRGSAAIEPELVDDATLFVQRSSRTLRAFRYIFEADGYRSPSLSNFASHLGAVRFAEIEYAAEPHGILWVRREDGSLVGFTFNADQSVEGWHRHDLSGGKIISMAVIPDANEQHDELWVVVERTIEGEQRYAIEKLTRTWDFDMTLDDAWFVDAGVRYKGEATDALEGFSHLEGREVYGLADGTPVGPLTVQNGLVQLPFSAANTVIGLGFESEGVTSELLNGAADGTAVGKTGRVHNLTALVWATGVLTAGVWVENDGEEGLGRFHFEDIELPKRFDTLDKASLYTGVTRYLPMPPSYTAKTVIAFRRPKETPLPMNLVALMPQLHKQDR